MFPKYLLFLIYAPICWAHSVVSGDGEAQVPGVTLHSNLGEPLYVTKLLKLNQTELALSQSSVTIWNENLVSYSGFFTVNEKYNSNLFFWFFPKTGQDSEKAPLLLWLQGGPGFTSMIGLFQENGPFEITEEGLVRRKYAWTNEYNVLYIDQPVLAGFSFTNDKTHAAAYSLEEAAESLYEALTQFFQLFPKLKPNAFYITGEGFASKFVVTLALKIHRLRATDLSSFNLKGLFMIAPIIDGLVNGVSNFWYQVGIIDCEAKAEFEEMEKQIESSINNNSLIVATGMIQTMFTKLKESLSTNLNDFTKPRACMEENYVNFLQKSEIRKAIHVGNTNFHKYANNVSDFLLDDMSSSVVKIVEELLEHYPVAFVAGQLNVMVPYPLVVNVLQKLNWTGTKEYKSAKRQLLVANESGEDYGYYKSAGNLKEILIRNAGLMVCKDQPRPTLDLLKKFINNEL